MKFLEKTILVAIGATISQLGVPAVAAVIEGTDSPFPVDERSGSMPPRAALPQASAPSRFRAPLIAPERAIWLGPNLHKATGKALRPGGPEWVATVRLAPGKAGHRLAHWYPVEGGFVARIEARAEGAYGLRVRLDLGAVPGAMEVRAAGEDGRVFTMVLDPVLGPEAWTPWTDGPVQVVEVFSPVRPSDGALSAAALLNYDVPDFAKAAASCTVSSKCTVGDAALDAAIAEARRGVMRISGVSGGSGFSCSATLVNTPKFPAAYVLTAHHCVSSPAEAGSLTSRFFYETSACGATDVDPAWEQVSGGMQLVYTNFNVDTSLLLMNSPPPSAAVYLGFNSAKLQAGDAVVSLSHPRADAMRLARGSYLRESRPSTSGTGQYPQNMYMVKFTSGDTEAGSSGSGLFTLAGTSLQLRGTLFGGPSGIAACNANNYSDYSRMDIFGPQIDPYVGLASVPADDAPNRALDYFGTPLDPGGAETLNLRSTPLSFLRQISPGGDMDVFRFALSEPRTVAMWSEGGQDLVGALLNENGDGLWANDDAQQSSNDFGITRTLAAGTYYLQVAHYEPLGTGPYAVRFEAYDVGTNYTDLWWNQTESGWGMNINHQGNTLFATLFTYDADGSGMWLVLASGQKQTDGTYFGKLYRPTGPAFNAAPWTPIDAVEVGTMRIAFDNADVGSITYTVNGVQVFKPITRQRFGTAPTCSWSKFDRSWSFHFQDLWWNPAESGWGLNLTQQGKNMFATLFTYVPGGGKGMWLVMSNGSESSPFVISGTLYRTTGPAFNASPWTPITATPVGTMTLDFTDGDSVRGDRGVLTYTVDGVTVTKQIQRQEFALPHTECRANPDP